jgi:hypothetical protein
MSFTIDKTKVITYPPSALRDFHVYGYEWIDNLNFVRPLREFIADPGEYVQIAKERFLAAGWDGDGRIGLLWLPPFVFPREAPTEGIVVWHVKQEEDGVSWLLSPVPLPFREFQGQASAEEVIEKLFPPS